MKINSDKHGIEIELEYGDLPKEARTHCLPVGQRHVPAGKGPTIEIAPEAVELLGPHGRLLSESKSDYHRRFPNHEVWFNACIFDLEGVEIWFGDLDLDTDEPELQKLAELVGPVYATCERPYRFDGLPAAPEAGEDIRRYGGRGPGRAGPR